MADESNDRTAASLSAASEKAPSAVGSTRYAGAGRLPRGSRPPRRELSLADRIEQAVTSLFFIGLGIIFLYAAYKTMYQAHATFSFVLVVVGVAILLYGTGTHGAGSFDSDIGAFTYKIGIAGGAGILALGVGYGLVKFSKEMRDAFQVEQKYVRLQIEPTKGISEGNFASYFPDVTTRTGEIIPSLRRGTQLVEVYVPYLPGEQQKVLIVRLRNPLADKGPKQLLPVYEDRYVIDIVPAAFRETYGGHDVPVYSGTITLLRENEERAHFPDVIKVNLEDPNRRAGEKPTSDKQQPDKKTDDLPVPPIIPSTEEM
jgi:hypothetical protein